MHRQIVVGVLLDAVKLFPRLLCRIDVDHRIGKISHVMHHFVAHLLGDGVAFRHAQ